MRSVLMTTVALLIAAGVTFVPPAYGTTSMEVTVGFAKPVAGAITPVRIHISHSGLSVEAQLVLAQTVSSPWNGVFTETFTVPLHLGQRANQRLTLYFPLNSVVYPLRVRLESASGTTLAQQDFDFRDQGVSKPLAVSLSETAFPSTLPTGETVYPVNAAQLPQDAVGFEAIRRLYLGRFDPSTLGKQQQRALLDWVMLGGELVLFTGENWYVQDAAFLRPWLPLGAPRLQTLAVAEGTDLPLLSGDVRGEVVYALGGRPWLLEQRVGRGKIWLSTVDPLNAPPPEAFWRPLVPDDKVDERDLGQIARDAFERQMLFFPSRTSLAVLLIVFIGGVGVWSWLSSRQAWAVGGSVLWVVSFSVAAVWLFNRLPYAQPLVVAEYGLERALPGGGAWQQVWQGVYAQRQEHVTLTYPADAVSRQLLPQQRGDHLFDLDYVVGDSTRLGFVAKSHQIRSFLSVSRVRPTLRWTLERGRLTVSSATKLSQVWLWHEASAYDLGAFSQGETREFRLEQLDRIVLEQQLPPAVLRLWEWATLSEKRSTVLAAWHEQSVVALSPDVQHPVFQLVVTKVAP